jgi:elongation factor G
VGAPQVAFKEAIRKEAKAEGRFVKQSGGRGQFGVAEITVRPRERGAGFEWIDATKGGSIPKEYIPAVKFGVTQALETGPVGGYPTIDVSVSLIDGQYHNVDSSEIAFRNAGILAAREALRKASPVLLEPIMKLEIVTPDEQLGDVLGDVNSRRGQIMHMEPRGKLQVIRATIPLAESFGYATSLRSLTQGRGTYSMEFDHYAEVPTDIANKIAGGAREPVRA